MSSVYSIDFSEPLKEGFEIPAGSFNGPGGAFSHTSLRLHGRGALEWGEAVNEDLVRLTENFASASPPQNPLTGQLWAEVAMYRKGPNTWFKYDPNASGADPKWVAFTPSTTTGQPSSTGTAGQHAYDSAAGTLWGYFAVSTVGTNVNEWRERAFTTQATDNLPSNAEAPITTLKVYNVHHDSWAPPQSVAASPSSEPPTNPQIGALWFNTTTGDLTVWDGAAWQVITTGGATSGDLDMSNAYTVTNLMHPPVDDFDAATKKYVDDAPFVSLAGDTMTGALVLSGAPTLALHAATKQYVDTAVAGATSGTLAVVHNNPVGSVSYNAGDIAIAAGKIYIALAAGSSTVPGGNWKQVWPATYS